MKTLLIGVLFFFLGASLMLNFTLLNTKRCKFSIKYTKGANHERTMSNMQR
jgi:hypothetical protein